MNIAIIACVSSDGALNGFAPSPLDRLFFKMMTLVPDHNSIFQRFSDALEEGLDAYYLLREMLIALQEEENRNAVLVGRRTWEDARPWGLNQQPLEGRHVIVLTHEPDPVGSAIACSIEQAMDCSAYMQAQNLWIAGGAQVYHQALAHPAVTVAYLTQMDVESQNAMDWWPQSISDNVMCCFEDDEHRNEIWWRMASCTPWIEDADGRKLRFTKWEKQA